MKRQRTNTSPPSGTPKPRHDFVYLASQSPRRRQLLEQIGVRHELLVADASEDAEALEAERPGELPLAYVRRVTLAKLDAARQRLIRRGLPSAPIVCSDTTVALGRRIYGKPLDAADAAATLGRLSGRTHRVITAVAIAVGDTEETLAVSTSHVSFADLDAETVERYVASGEPFGKAGAYAIQGAAGAWVTRIVGSYSGIMGLPLHETAELLRAVGVRW
ncbi:MAG: Maf family protein [Rhizobacter sp.]